MKPFASSIPSPPAAWAQFHIGPLTVHTYALCILAGIVAAVLITGVRLRHRGAPEGLALDAAIWAVPLGIVVARIYHVVTHPGDYFAAGDDLWNVFAIWDGGNAIYGAEIGGAVGLWIACRRAGIRFLSFADALAPALLVAQATGRLGNWFNHELFGVPTTLPWGLQIEASNPKFPPGLPAGTLFSPLFLYEIVWDLLGALVIVLLERRVALRWGRAIAVYFVWYGIGRAYLESIRIDPTSGGLLGVPDNEWTSFLLVALGVVLFVVQLRRHPGPEPDVRLPRLVDAPAEDQAVLDVPRPMASQPVGARDPGPGLDDAR
ncbi:prolipoprotein diacylglyceryl transferase [Amnibacterium soli]|uniref:Phosphatidylglycerol--prolipoprotein diacylglyceryl transferase n=1 Tax=Amnibacterium soli TaxID=1282736 RepID=A0ABP8ZGC7_9MICO